jgi:Zn-dependent protease
MNLLTIVIVAVPAVLAVTVHEVAHGWVANRLGDPTAAQAGRLTLNPFKHVDLVGTLLVPIGLKLMGSPFLFGWAKPVPVDWRNQRQLPSGWRRRHSMVVVPSRSTVCMKGTTCGVSGAAKMSMSAMRAIRAAGQPNTIAASPPR